jgi:hypothetical protein
MKKLVVILGILAIGITMAFASGHSRGRGYHNEMMGNQGGTGYQGGMKGNQDGMMEYQRQQPYDSRPGYQRGEPDYQRDTAPGYQKNVPGYQKNMPGHNFNVPFYGNQQSK